MRIRFFVPRCTPDNSHGRYVMEMAKRFAREHEVAVYSGAFWPSLHSDVHRRFLPVPNRPAIARLAALWAISSIVIKRRSSDVVHIQGADAAVGNVVTAHCCNAAMRAVMTDAGGSLTRRLNYSLGKAAERYCFTKQSTRIVIAVSRKVKTEICEHYGVDPERILTIPLGVDGEGFHPPQGTSSRARDRERLGLGREDFVALFVGGDYRLKGLVPLLKAAGTVARVKIVVAGVRPDSHLKAFIQTNGLGGRVTILGPTTDIAALYKMADCFVLPTRYDTFSLVTLEAMASGLPVVVSRAAGVTELLSPERDSLLLEDPGDVEAIAQYLTRLEQSRELRMRLGAEARRTAERYSWDEVASRTVAAYRNALAVS